MTEEIKEILDNIKSLANNHTDKYGIKVDGMRLRNYELKLINDYITNLQQKDFESQKEITKLKDKLEQQRKEYQDTYKDVRIEIKEKNERIANLQQENDYYFKKNNEISNLNTSLRSARDNYKSRCKKANDFIDNYDVFKEFSFPLMKRDIENQIKSSIDYEFNSTFRTKLKNILNGVDENG